MQKNTKEEKAKENELGVMHVKVGSPRASFAGAIREEGESDAEEYFGTEGTDDSKFSIESLVALPIAPGAK